VSPRLILNSYAKLNLYLAVLGRRRDNYHNLNTVFERISLADRIVLSPRRDDKIRIITASCDIPKDNTNLAFRAACLLKEVFGLDKGVDIKIHKRIPVGSGMGGGSSNAASVLMGLNKLWRLNLNPEKLAGLARKIGSDVPFFVYNHPFAQGLSRGDKIRPIRQLFKLRLWHILVIPKIKVSTPLIYKKWDEHSGLTKPRQDVKILLSALRKKDTSLVSSLLFNDLEQITSGLYPEVKQVKKTLSRSGLESTLMSGSGPAVFGFLASRKEAATLCKQLKAKKRSWRVFVAHTI